VSTSTPQAGPSRRAVLIFCAAVGVVVLVCLTLAVLTRPETAPVPPPAPRPQEGKVAGSGRNDMPINTFRSLAPRDPKVLTVFCELSDHYGGGFRGTRDVNYSFRLRDRAGDCIWAYAGKGAGVGDELTPKVAGGGRWVTLEIQFEDSDPSYVVLKRVVK
jgi:hypothetical protein